MILSFKGRHSLFDHRLFIKYRDAHHCHDQYDAQQEGEHHEVWPEVRLRSPQIEDAYDETESSTYGQGEISRPRGGTSPENA